MERFFTQHSVLRDRDPDELGGRARSDSEASSESSCDEGEQRASERVHSVHDPTGPWRQTPVDGPWGQPAKRTGGRKARDFQSKFTGPKGVLNDYKAHKRSVRDERARKEQERHDVLARIAKGVASITSATTSSSNSNGATNQSECCDGDSDCECEALMDAAFLQKYQEQRLQELTEAAKRRCVRVHGSVCGQRTRRDATAAVGKCMGRSSSSRPSSLSSRPTAPMPAAYDSCTSSTRRTTPAVSSTRSSQPSRSSSRTCRCVAIARLSSAVNEQAHRSHMSSLSR